MLVDRATFPRDKICGGGLTPRSYKLLSQLLPQFRYDYNSVHRLKLCIEGEQVLDFQMDSEIRIVKRRQFDAQLLEEYQKNGGQFINEALTAIEEKDGQVIVTLKSGRQIACKYLVGADGANSRVRKYLNPKSDHGILCMEQYGPKSKDNAIVGNLSRFYRQGYYYSFPNESYDVQGFGDYDHATDIPQSAEPNGLSRSESPRCLYPPKHRLSTAQKYHPDWRCRRFPQPSDFRGTVLRLPHSQSCSYRHQLRHQLCFRQQEGV